MRPQHSNTPSVFSCRLSCSWSRAILTVFAPWLYAPMIQDISFCWISSVTRGPIIFAEGWRESWLSREIHTQILMAFHKLNFLSTVSKSSFASTTSTKSSRWTFFSALLLSITFVILSAGQWNGSDNHGRPFHHGSASFTLLLWLLRSAGVSDVGTVQPVGTVPF